MSLAYNGSHEAQQQEQLPVSRPGPNGAPGSHDDFCSDEGEHDRLVSSTDGFDEWFDDLPARRVVYEAEKTLANSLPSAHDDVLASPETMVIVSAENVVRGAFARLCEEASLRGRTMNSEPGQFPEHLIHRVAAVSLLHYDSDDLYA